MNQAQWQKMKAAPGFVAALDQSGGSTPKALADYGVENGAWSSSDEMFALVHQMRARVVTSPSFIGERIIGAILFEGTMDRAIGGQPTADYLWDVKRVVPFLKVDQGLRELEHGVRLLKPMPQLATLLSRAKSKGIFGTKMRSVIEQANAGGIEQIVAQQFAVGADILAAGLIPIIEPEVSIHCPEKGKAEQLLKVEILNRLDRLPANQRVLLKLTLPECDNLYSECVDHPNVLRVLALSGGYSREQGNFRLRRNRGVVASFSRALMEGLSAKQSDAEFDETLGRAIESIYDASAKNSPEAMAIPQTKEEY